MPNDKTFGRTVSVEIQAEQSSLLPRYDELANAPAEAGSIVSITGNGTDAAGTYAHDGSGWAGPFGSSGTSYTDEMAQDAVGAMSDATLAYDDAAPSLGIADGSVGPAKLDSAGDYTFGSATADTLTANVTTHSTDLSSDYDVPAGEGTVLAGPITGTGSLSGAGNISVLQEGHQFTETVDAQGNDLQNVGSLSTGAAPGIADHVVTTDTDLTALESNISEGDAVYFGPGEFRVAFDLPADVLLMGQGEDTRLARDGDAPVLKFYGDAVDNRLSDGVVWNLHIDGDPDNTGGFTTPIIDCKWGDQLRFQNVTLEGKNTGVPGIRLHECWDSKYIACRFHGCGDNTADTNAAIYAYNGDTDNTNNHYFWGCRWEPIKGVPVYSDTSGTGNANHNIRLTDCKLHGHPGDAGRPAGAFVKGEILHMSIQSTQMLYSRGGFINIDGYRSRVVNSNFVSDAPDTDIVASSGYTTISNNSFGSIGSNYAIDVNGYNVAVTGNTIENKGIRIRKGRGTVANNAINAAPEHGIYAEGDFNFGIHGNAITNPAVNGVHVGTPRAVVVGNNVKSADGDSFHGAGATDCTFIGNVSDGPVGSDIVTTSGPNVVAGNVFLGGSVSLAGDNEVAANIGYTAADNGSASVADGGTIAHGLSGTPDAVSLTASGQGHIASVSAVDGTNITVGLVDDAGAAVGTAETVYWDARL